MLTLYIPFSQSASHFTFLWIGCFIYITLNWVWNGYFCNLFLILRKVHLSIKLSYKFLIVTTFALRSFRAIIPISLSVKIGSLQKYSQFFSPSLKISNFIRRQQTLMSANFCGNNFKLLLELIDHTNCWTSKHCHCMQSPSNFEGKTARKKAMGLIFF